jgi:hypothetical protein
LTTLRSVIQIGTLAAMPAASIPGRLYFTSDTLHVFRDNGTAWIDCTPVGGALANPMTAPGDIIVGGTGGTPTRLAAGANGNLLSIAAGVPAYVASLSESRVTNLTTDLAAKEVTANKGVANGYASLDASGLVPSVQIPPLAIGHTYVVTSQAAMLALAANVGDVAIRSDINETFILQTAPATTLGNWQQVLTPASPVQSVNGLIGVVSLASTNLSDSSALARLASGPAAAQNPYRAVGIYLCAENNQLRCDSVDCRGVSRHQDKRRRVRGLCDNGYDQREQHLQWHLGGWTPSRHHERDQLQRQRRGDRHSCGEPHRRNVFNRCRGVVSRRD